MKDVGALPEFECFDVGIVRSVAMYRQTGMYDGPLEYNFVMGVASGMPADPDLLPILLKLKVPEANWQVTAIGRAEIWPLHRRCAELGGHLRTGLEDTFYRPDGSKVDVERPADRDHGRARARRRAARSPAPPRPGGSSSWRIDRSRSWSHRLARNESRDRAEDAMSDLAATGGVPGPGRIGRVAIGDILRRAARRFPGSRCADRRRTQVTFTELDRDANRFANYLLSPRPEIRREDRDDLQQFGGVRQSAVRHPSRRAGLGADQHHARTGGLPTTSSTMPKCVSP